MVLAGDFNVAGVAEAADFSGAACEESGSFQCGVFWG